MVLLVVRSLLPLSFFALHLSFRCVRRLSVVEGSVVRCVLRFLVLRTLVLPSRLDSYKLKQTARGMTLRGLSPKCNPIAFWVPEYGLPRRRFVCCFEHRISVVGFFRVGRRFGPLAVRLGGGRVPSAVFVARWSLVGEEGLFRRRSLVRYGPARNTSRASARPGFP